LVVHLLSGDSIDEVAPKRAHTRANPEGPLTSVPDPEKIISKGKALHRQASGSAATSDPGIPIYTQSFISKKSFAEIVNPKETKNSSQAAKAEEPSFSSNITHSALEIEVSSHPQEPISSSSLNSSPDKPSESSLHTYTNLPVLEEIIQDLSSKGEENLASLLSQFYKASYFPSTSETVVQSEVRQTFIPDSGNSSPPSSPPNRPSPPLSPTSSSSSSIIKTIMAGQNMTRMEQILANRYAPLVLPNPLSAMPTGDYQKYMPKFTGAGEYTAEEHIEAFYAYAENINISEEDVWTRVFVQSLDGQARKWFKELPANSITGIEQLDAAFLKYWGERRDLLYYMSEFGNLKRKDDETVSDFIKRFNKMFGKIPAEIKPSDASAKITFSAAFDAEFCLILRERRSATLALMQDAALEVESNITASQKLKGRAERKKPAAESSSSSSNIQMEKMAKMLDTLTSEMSKLKVQNQTPARAKEPSNLAPRNPNALPYRRNNPQTQILQRGRNPNEDQRIRVPLQNVVMDEEQVEEQEEVEGDIHCVGDETGTSYLTQQDYEQSLTTEEAEGDLFGDGIFTAEDKNRYNLRSKSKAAQADAPASPAETAAPVRQKEHTSEDQPVKPSKEGAPASPKKVVVPVSQQASETQPLTEQQKDREAPSSQVKTADKAPSSFNFEAELQKIKIPIPLVELMKNEMFKRDILRTLDPQSVSHSADILNIYDDKPTITLGPMVEDRDESCPPFYISLNIHEKTLHNCLLDSGASHNLMPKAVMDELGLEITKPYHDLFSFDSRKVKCLGMIKDLAVTLTQASMKTMVMDIVVADIPPKFGCLLSRAWMKRLGGTLQMDLSYATIPVFGGVNRRLYRESQLAYVISDEKNPNNHPIYAVDTDMGSCILQFDDSLSDTLLLRKPSDQTSVQPTEIAEHDLWTMFFDGACTKESAGAGIVFISPSKKTSHLSFKLNFKVTNNIAEYEALLLGLNAAKEKGIRKLQVFGDADLIIQQVNKSFQAKHVRLKAYRDEVLEAIKSFADFKITFVPRALNEVADSLAVSACAFIPPLPHKLSYEIQVRHRPSLPDNIKFWKVFEDDAELTRFLAVIDEFAELQIDQDNEHDDGDEQPKLKSKIAAHEIVQLSTNKIPKGLVPLERLFDNNDVAVKLQSAEKDPDVFKYNVASEQDPRHVNLASHLSDKQKNDYGKLLKEFSDIFAWQYDDLKTFDTEVIQHKIPLNKDTKPFRQKLRSFNPLLLPTMEKEIRKLLDARIIIPLRYSEWIANLVPVRKKNGEIRLCVDFRNLNKCSRKDNYPLPKMEHMLQKVSGAKVMSFIDGFSGYNQIAVHPEDREKTAFTTPWGTFMYEKMPFGLMNAGATFQRAMDIAFIGEKDKFVLIYLDDITVFSSSHELHLQHLRKTFLKCRKYGISLNPKKSNFALKEGKLLGHIVSEEGVKIDPKRVEAIRNLSLPRSKKDIQSFLGTINFVRRFIGNFAELTKNITAMLRKDSEIKWTEAARQSFNDIKEAITTAPVLISPDFSKVFYIFSFASNDTIAAVLLQKNIDDQEQPVAFFSKVLRDAETKYELLEKQAYALVKSLKAFRVYILQAKVIAFVPSSSVKDVLVQPDIDGKRSKWIARLIEFDVEIRPAKLVKGQGLARLLAEENCKLLDINLMNIDAENVPSVEDKEDERMQVSAHIADCEWYSSIIRFLQTLSVPSDLTKTQRRALKLRAINFCITDNLLFWKNPIGLLLRCVNQEEATKVMNEFHNSECGGHHYWKTTAHKILRSGYYWPSLFSDVYEFVKTCDKCQRFEGKKHLKSLPLKPIVVTGPFQQWGLDFIGEIHPPSSGQHRWILVATDYFTKWIEAIPTRNANHTVIINFLQENIFARFGCPKRLVADNAAAFKDKHLVKLCEELGVQLVHSTAYYPQGNGLAESSNKSLVKIIQKLLEQNARGWDSKLKFALWADRVTSKKSIGTSPFKLVYGTEAIFPVQLALPVAKFLQETEEEPNDLTRRIHDLVQLQQDREQLLERTESHQQMIKRNFDKKTKSDVFKAGDMVLKWDAARQEKGKHGKFEALWTGPFIIAEAQQNNTFILHTLSGEPVSGGPFNGRFLKIYFS
jgi:ribonuclease HI